MKYKKLAVHSFLSIFFSALRKMLKAGGRHQSQSNSTIQFHIKQNRRKKNIMQLAMIGLGRMGGNMAKRIAAAGHEVVGYDRSPESDRTVASLEEMVAALTAPRIVWVMVPAGEATDSTINELAELLEPGDMIIDGGNSRYTDDARHAAELEPRGIHFMDCGVSGGVWGIDRGYALMVGGSEEDFERARPIFEALKPEGDSGLVLAGPVGGGHFAKMVHNGIEYGDMQLISEAYSLLKNRKGLDNDAMAVVFDEWNGGELDSFLIEITANILRFRDEDGKPLLDKILDVAGQKGTGKWSAIAAMDENDPLTLITEAVYARLLSALYPERIKAARLYSGKLKVESGKLSDNAQLSTFNFQLSIEDVRQALYAAKLISYAQGFSLLRHASEHYGWDLDYGTIARIWRKGCIIRSVFLQKITEAYRKDPDLENLLFDDFFHTKIQEALPAWRRIVAEGALSGVALPAMSSALNYFDGLRTLYSAANMIQAQRDYFGAHTYERTDRERGHFFHTNWTGEGGNTVSGTYSV